MSLDSMNSIAVPRLIRGVYVLIDGIEIVYVGQSNNVAGRIAQHVGEGVKQFTSARVIEIPDGCMDEVESELMFRYKPKYNGRSSWKGLKQFYFYPRAYPQPA